jgi:hypothetical protein
VDAVAEFVLEHSRPLLISFSVANAASIFKSSFQVLGVIPPGDALGTRGAMLAAAKAARAVHKKLQLVLVDPQAPESAQLIEFFGVKSGVATPRIFGFISGEAPRKHELVSSAEDGSFTVEALTAFAAGVVDGSAPRFRLSAPAPESNDGPVTIVVADTFEEIVLAPDKDVLLCLCAPESAECDALAPVYAKLGRRFAAVPNVVIASMDASVNEHPMAKVAKSLPAVLFFPARRDGGSVPFDKAPTLKALTKFIKQHAATQYELPRKQQAAAAAAHDELR